MMSPSQFVRGEPRHVPIEDSPLGLTGTVGLLEREIGTQVGLRQGLEEWVSAGPLRRQEYDGGNLQRRLGQLKSSSPQINLEFLDAASASDNWGLGDSRGLSRSPKPAQRVGANVQEMVYSASSYAIFGFLAGLLGALVGYSVLTFQSSRQLTR